jgi:hypothetical protein
MMSHVTSPVSPAHRARPTTRSRIGCVVAVAITLVAAACSTDDGATGDDGGNASGTDTGTEQTGATGPESVPPTDSGPDPSSGATGDPDGGDVGATVSIEPSEYITVAAELTVVTDAPVKIDVIATSGEHVVTVPRTASSATEHSIPVVGMRAERDYDIDVVLVGESDEVVGTQTATFTTGALPDDFVDYEFSADPERSSLGYTLLEISGSGTPYLLALDVDGEVVWYYRNTGVVGGVEPTDRGTFLSNYWPIGIREFDLLGNVVGNWQFQADPDADPGDQADVIDEDLLDQFVATLAGNPGDPAPLPVSSDDVSFTSFHHESWPMPNGNILTLSTTLHDLTPEQRMTFCPDDPLEFGIISDVVVEFEPSGRVVRTWDLWDAVDIEQVPGHELCEDRGPFTSELGRDWMHANAVIYDADRDAVIVSARHTNQVIALEHGDEEGPQSDVLWIFGEHGTMELDGDPPYYQHAVELQDDGSILLYDNGNDRPGTVIGDPDTPMYSRAVLYEVDDSSTDRSEWMVTQRWEHTVDDADGSVVYARFLGDADLVSNGNVLVTHGGIDLPDDDDFDHAVVIEVEPSGGSGGEIVWEFRIGSSEDEVTIYRSERIPTFYFGPQWTSAG